MNSIKRAWGANILTRPKWLLACEPCIEVVNTLKPICFPFYSVPSKFLKLTKHLKIQTHYDNMLVALEVLELKSMGWWEDKCSLWLIPKMQSKNKTSNT
jgi:hypothetical protein